MAKKCVHKGCGKKYENDDEECVYHPGPPIFHEGQKGWKCCKPRVLTFEEFMDIEPCTTGKHSDVDDTPAPEPVKAPEITEGTQVNLGSLEESLPAPAPRLPSAQAAPKPAASPAPPPESEDDDASVPLKEGMTCRRKTCGATHKGGDRGEEKCVHHPGAPIFHEGSKGWSCCKRRVLEFDQFLNIEGCKTKDRHLFVGSGKKDEKAGREEKLETVKNDYYQTATTVVASLYLKKIDKSNAVVDFHPTNVTLDLRTTDGKRYQSEFPLFATIKPEESKFRILGTKLEMTFAKADGTSWAVLRSDDKPTGEILQVGRAGRA
ncbi:chord-domain-containing protein [Ophiobolus disseminans]|uniref:Chord-domain-containing protein n=1 Tax=Ophiobolus disseminans TaxID=1469910 RepID=A0A6A7AK61_9PLEO|nr:chord-domain-containing protein [Ophiobolus disseminans]